MENQEEIYEIPEFVGTWDELSGDYDDVPNSVWYGSKGCTIWN